MKRCSKCQDSKPLEDFPKNGKTKTGRQAYRSACKECEKGRDVSKRNTTPRKERANAMENNKKCPYCKEGITKGEEVKRYYRQGETMTYHLECSKKYEELLESLGGAE